MENAERLLEEITRNVQSLKLEDTTELREAILKKIQELQNCIIVPRNVENSSGAYMLNYII